MFDERLFLLQGRKDNPKINAIIVYKGSIDGEYYSVFSNVCVMFYVSCMVAKFDKKLHENVNFL